LVSSSETKPCQFSSVQLRRSGRALTASQLAAVGREFSICSSIDKCVFVLRRVSK